MTIFLKQNHKIIESSRSICGLISLSYRHDNLVPGRFIWTSKTTKTATPERVMGGVQGRLGAPVGVQGAKPPGKFGVVCNFRGWRTRV